MATIKEPMLKPGDHFIHGNPAGFFLEGVLHGFDAQEGETTAWVVRTNSSTPLDELFPGGKTSFSVDDNCFTRVPQPPTARSTHTSIV